MLSANGGNGITDQSNNSASSHALVAFAFVEEAYAQTGDLISGLLPLFAPLLVAQTGRQFDPNRFAQDVCDRYGIPMSPLVAVGLIDRLADANLLYLEDKNSHVYRVSKIASPTKSGIDDKSIENVLDGFVKFANQSLQRSQLTQSPEALKSGFLTRLTSAQFLSAVERKETDYFIGNKLTLKKPEHEENTADVESAIDILSAEFALRTMEKGGEPAGLLIKIATGALIAEVVLTLQVSSGSTSLDKLTVFVDGPLLLDRLDLSSIELKEFAKSLFELMEKAKIHVSVFSHTLEEMRGSIKAPLDAMARGEEPFGPLGSRIRWDGSHAAYARSVLDSLEDTLQELHVTVFNADELRTAAGLHRLPEAIEDSLRNNVGPLFVGLERRIRDAASVSSIMRLRSGPKPHSIADTGSLFVTRNPVVSKASTSHLIFKKVISDTEVPPAMLDRTLAGYLWFVVGGNVGEITRQKLIANCSYVMTPRNDIISKVRQYLTETDPQKAKTFAAILLDRRAQRCLVRTTLGFPSAINADNAEAILQEVRESVASEVTEQAAQKEAQLRAAHKMEIAVLVEAHKVKQDRSQAALESSEQLGRENAAELSVMREQLSRAEAEKRSDVDWRMNKAVSSARNSKRVVACLLLIAYLVIVFVVYELSPAWGIWKLVGALIVALFGFWLVPEVTFKFIGTLVWKWRFNKAIASLGLRRNLDEFTVNIESGTVTRKQS